MSNEIALTIEDAPAQEDMEAYSSILKSLNRLKTGEPGYRKLQILARDKDKRVIGGLNGEMYLGWLFIENLALDERGQNQGLGSQLLKAAEDEACRRRCFAVYLEVFSFQGLAFYEKHGYKVFGELKDCPQGHSRFFLYKRLSGSGR